MDKPAVSTGKVIEVSADAKNKISVTPASGQTVYYPTGLGFSFQDATSKRYILIRLADCLAWK